jgi:N-acetylmuramoyl-L-alanine amidase
MDGRAAEVARTLPRQVVLSHGRTTQGSRIHRFRPRRTGDRRARSHQRGNVRMKQIGPHRNSPYRVKVVRCDMLTATRVRRRLILRRLAGGGAIFCSLLGNMDRQQAQGARVKGERPPPLVILDPGHGGRDPGATGVAGTLEKDVTLASALALKASLEAEGRYRVALTRARDHYVAPDHRVDLARDLGASLFLSMHADQLSDPGVRGASV